MELLDCVVAYLVDYSAVVNIRSSVQKNRNFYYFGVLH